MEDFLGPIGDMGSDRESVVARRRLCIQHVRESDQVGCLIQQLTPKHQHATLHTCILYKNVQIDSVSMRKKTRTSAIAAGAVGVRRCAASAFAGAPKALL